MIDPQQKVTLNVNPSELWILYHRVNQNHHSFWYGKDKERTYAGDKENIAIDAGDYQSIKHDLWLKINDLMNSIGMKAETTISSQIGTPIRVNDHSVDFETNGDICVGCEEITYEILRQIYEKATGLLKGE